MICHYSQILVSWIIPRGAPFSCDARSIVLISWTTALFFGYMLHHILDRMTKSHHHHHHVVPLARISLTLSRHFSLSFIASGRFSGLRLVSSHSCCMYVLAGRPALARPYVGVHRSTSLMS